MKTGFFEVSPGHLSMMRLLTFLYMIICGTPINILLGIGVYRCLIGDCVFDFNKIALIMFFFVINNLVWMAPKLIQKVIEEKGLLTKLLANNEAKG